MRAVWLVVGFAGAIALMAAACSDREGANGGGSPSALATFDSNRGDLSDIARAVEAAGTYRITVTQENLVLPRWGGSDGGTVSVDLKAEAAVAELKRTGEGRYTIVFTKGETYFKRETCSTWTRIQVGQDVLSPFMRLGERLSRAKLSERLPTPANGNALLKVDLPALGEVTMEVDAKTSRPVRIASDSLTNNGKRLEWTFDGWGDKVDVPSISTDRTGGPGGNPC